MIELFAKCTVYLNSVITDKSRSPKLKTDYCSAPGTGSIIAYTNGMSDSDDENDAAYNSIFNTKFFLFGVDIILTLTIDASENESRSKHALFIIAAFFLAIWFYLVNTVYGNGRQYQQRLPNRDRTIRRTY